MNKDFNINSLTLENDTKNKLGVLKVCLVCVCYNAYEDALCLLTSIEEAYANSDCIDLTVVLSDNSTSDHNLNLISKAQFSFNYLYVKNENIGYFPGFTSGLTATQLETVSFDFVIVSNVDLTIGSNFFVVLSHLKCEKNIGVIAPKIISAQNGMDSNPKIIVRPSKLKIKILRLLCQNSMVFALYQKFNLLRGKKKAHYALEAESISSARPMYGAHGAFMIFTQSYFKVGADVNYPRFLFGEEGFVAEQLRKFNLIISHEKNLIVNDREHGSTSLQSSKFICKEHRKSYDYFLENYMQ